MPFRRFYSGKACLSAEYSTESFDFPRIIPRKGMPFHGISAEGSNFPRIIRGKSNFVHEYLREIREKILNYYLTFIRDLLGAGS